MDTENNRLTVRVATSLPAIISLGILLLNDWYLKAAYGNSLTGKLSDFAGIFLLALLAFAFFPQRKLAVALGICAAFVWWKSPLAQPLIDVMHFLGQQHFDRVVDYTDLVALVMVPVAWHMVVYRERHARPPGALRRAVGLPMLLVSASAMLATSYTAQHEGYEIRPSDPAATFDPVAIATTLAEAAESEGLRRIENLADAPVAVYFSKWVELRYEIVDSTSVRISILESGGGAFGRKPEKVEALRRRIVRELSEKFKGLEFVLAIPGPPVVQRSTSEPGVGH